MKIIITRLGDCLIADGINLFIYELSDALINLGHEVHLLSDLAENVPIREKKSAYENAVKDMFSVKEVPNLTALSFYIHTWKSPFLSNVEENLLFASKGSKIVNRISPDMIIFNGVTTMVCPHFFRVAVCHDLQFRLKTAKYYDSIIYPRFDRIVAASTEVQQGLTRQLHLHSTSISVIPICIDISRFSPRCKSKRKRAILHIGTRPEKRPDISVDAFETVARNDPEVELLIAGQIDPRVPPLFSQIKQKEEGIRKRISFLGRLSKDQLAELYSSVKATCVPSDYVVPVCSPTVIESLASGTPVVGSISAISQDILRDYYTGFRVRPGDVATYASKLQLIIKDDDLWSKMSRNAINIAKRCDKIRVAQDYLSLHERFSG